MGHYLKSVYNLGYETGAIRKEFFKKYELLPWRYRIQICQRWLGAPYLQAEKYLPKEGLILDLGCGLGNFCHVLTLTGKKRKVVGIDFDKERIKLARKTVTKNENLVFRSEDLRKARLERCKGAVLFDVLHHLRYNFHQELLTKIYHVLEPGGILVMMESDNKPWWKYLVWRIWELVAIGFSITRGESLSPRNKKDLTKILEDVGFQVKAELYHKGRLFPHLLYVCRK